MIKLEAFVDDNKVAKVLHALDGLVRQLAVVPVRNAVVKKKKVTAAGNPTTAREIVDSLIKQSFGSGQTELTTKHCIEVAKSLGISEHSIGTLLPSLAKQGILRRKERGVYKIVQQEAK